MLSKLDKLKLLFDCGSMDVDIMRYIPGLVKIFYQGQLDSVKAKNLMLVQLILIVILICLTKKSMQTLAVCLFV